MEGLAGAPELLDLILSALQLRDLLPVRLACRLLHARVQPRFLPVEGFNPAYDIFDMADVESVYSTTVRLQIRYFSNYLQWLRSWWRIYDEAHVRNEQGMLVERRPDKLLELRAMSSHLAAYYSLAPWWRAYGEMVPTPWAPEQWLREALSGRQFYQARVRDEDDAFRTFYTTPAEAWPFLTGRDAAPRTRRVVLAPLDVSSAKKADALMPVLSETMLSALQVVHELIAVLLPGCDVAIMPKRELSVSNPKMTRPDAQRATRNGQVVRQLSSAALQGARVSIDQAVDAELRSANRARRAADEPFIAFVVAPHLYPARSEELAWVYSTPLHEDEANEWGEADQRIDAWVRAPRPRSEGRVRGAWGATPSPPLATRRARPQREAPDAGGELGRCAGRVDAPGGELHRGAAAADEADLQGAALLRAAAGGAAAHLRECRLLDEQRRLDRRDDASPDCAVPDVHAQASPDGRG